MSVYTHICNNKEKEGVNLKGSRGRSSWEDLEGVNRRGNDGIML